MSTKTKTKNDPWLPAQPYILKGMEQTSQVFDQNQPRLQDMSNQAYEAFNSISPEAFQSSPFVKGAQDTASAISGGALLGANPGQATYARLQREGNAAAGGFGRATGGIMGNNPQAGVPMDQRVYQPGSLGYQMQQARGMVDGGSDRSTGMNMLGLGGGGRPLSQTREPAGDPSMGLLSRMAGDTTGSAGDAALRGMAGGGGNPVASGAFLNAQPTAGLYSDTIGGKYLDNENPYLEGMIAKSRQNALTGANRLFSARGMGTGLSTPFAKVAAGATADAENSLRYQNYEAERGRQMQAAGLSDQAWSGERGRMDSMYNAGQDRSLAAAQALNSSGQAGFGQRLAAAQALGGQYDAGVGRGLQQQGINLERYNADQNRGLARYSGDQDRALDAARAGDAAQQSQVQQMLTALGLTGDLRGAEFTGIGPALALLNSAADIPYVGTAALNGQIRQASNGYGVTTQSGGLGQALLGAGAQLGSAYLGRPGG